MFWWDASQVRDDDGRKLSHEVLEELRFRSARQVVDEKASADDVARTLGLSRSTVFGWAQAYREGGAAALKAKPIPGRPPKLTDAQQQKLLTLMTGADPRQLGFDFALWTRDMAVALIKREFGVSMSVSAVGRLLHRLGLSVQRPLWRAWQQNEEAVRAWKEADFPAIRDAAARVGGTIYFGDEAGLRSDYHAGTTWAPLGMTPVVKTTGARHSINMISAVTTTGAMKFATYTGSFTAEVFTDFLGRLAHDTTGPVFLIVDGHLVHRSKKVKTWVESTNEAVHLHPLPSYSPKLNPDEWVWKNVKADRVGRAGITSADDFRAKAISALHRLQKLPGIIRGFFADSALAYITAT